MKPWEQVIVDEAKGRGWPEPLALQNIWTCKRCGFVNYPWINTCIQGCAPMDGSQSEPEAK